MLPTEWDGLPGAAGAAVYLTRIASLAVGRHLPPVRIAGRDGASRRAGLPAHSFQQRTKCVGVCTAGELPATPPLRSGGGFVLRFDDAETAGAGSKTIAS